MYGITKNPDEWLVVIIRKSSTQPPRMHACQPHGIPDCCVRSVLGRKDLLRDSRFSSFLSVVNYRTGYDRLLTSAEKMWSFKAARCAMLGLGITRRPRKPVRSVLGLSRLFVHFEVWADDVDC